MKETIHLAYENLLKLVKEELKKHAQFTKDDLERTIIEIILGEWDKIANAIDMTLINHKYRLLTFVITVDKHALFIRFKKSRETKDWVFWDFKVTERGAWPYKWEYRIGEGLVERNYKVKETIRYA